MLLQAVRSVASGGKFYRLPPDEENTGNAGAHDLSYKSSEFWRTSWRAGQLWGNITTTSRSHFMSN